LKNKLNLQMKLKLFVQKIQTKLKEREIKLMS